MADLTTRFAGVVAPNPFWLASGPPTNTAGQVLRAFDAGWGGAVWKTIGAPVVNVSSRYSALDWHGRRMMGLNNIELISDRPIDANLREIAEVKARFPHHPVIASLMVESTREAWRDIARRAEDAGADALELNFGCPHGMNERGMGSAVGQVPEYIAMITAWVKEAARTPVIVKLTPNVTDIRLAARAAREGGANAIAAINTINSITGVDLDTLTPRPDVGGKSTHGGYCGPAVKPIALHMVRQIAADDEVALPVSAIGGVSDWRDAAEFLLLGASCVQACTAPMHYGFRIVEEMCDGLNRYMDAKSFRTLDDLRGRSLPRVTNWNGLDIRFKSVARIHPELCIGCQLCYTACWDGGHQCIHIDGFDEPGRPAHRTAQPIVATPHSPAVSHATPPERIPHVDEEACVGCNLCRLVCPVDDCITMERVDSEQTDSGGVAR